MLLTKTFIPFIRKSSQKTQKKLGNEAKFINPSFFKQFPEFNNPYNKRLQ